MLPTLQWRVEAGAAGAGVQVPIEQPHATNLGWCKLQQNSLSWNIISSLHLPPQQQQKSPCVQAVLQSLVQADTASFVCSSNLGHSFGKKTTATKWEFFAIAQQEGVESMEQQLLPSPPPPPPTPPPAPGNGSMAQPLKDKADGREGKMLAAVDMGTNSFHMVVVRADKLGHFELVDMAKEDVRLGSGGGGSGSPDDISIISPDAEQRALVAIKRFKQLAATWNAEMRLVATSAVREARNRRMFVRRVLEAAGVEVEVLSGQEEACLIYQGVLQALPVYDKAVLVVDIGGGSTEFVLGRASKPSYATSLKLGHIRLSEQFLGLERSNKEELKKEQIEELRRHIQVILADSGVIENVQSASFEMAIGSSGTIESIEHMINHAAAATGGAAGSQMLGNANTLHEREFTAAELGMVVKKVCKAKTVEQRMKIPGLPEKRADVIVGGAILLEEIFLALGIRKMKVSPYALREGVIVDTLAKTLANYTPGVNIRRVSVLNLASKFNIDQRLASAQHSARLAKEIVVGLQECRSGLGQDCMSELALLLQEDDIELMEAATVLHYVGMFMNHKSYHRHSHYLIKNNEHLLGFSPLEIEVIALLARYHRKKVPSSKDEDFAMLPEEVQKKVQAMCAVMRVAVALDRCDTGAIEHVHVYQQPGSVMLAVVPAVDSTGALRDVSLEVWAARTELPYFEKIFKRRPSIVVADEHDLESMNTDPVSFSLSS